MRITLCCSFLLALGCGSSAVPAKGPTVTSGPDAALPAAEDPTVTSGPDAALPPDLGTRKAGSDWPRFLGPTGDSVSPETGVVAPWPKEGPRLVWGMNLGSGYSAPTVSRGRLFVFD